MPENNKKPVVLLLINGFGLSTSVVGNAVSFQNMPNFANLWKSYEHFPISPTANRPTYNIASDREVVFSEISSGDVTEPDKSFIDRKIRSFDLNINPKLRNLLGSVSAHKSSIHLIGHLSKEDETGSMEHLLSFIKSIKITGIKDINIVLVIDGSFETKSQVQKKLEQFSEALNQIETGEIKLIAGQNCFLNLDKSSVFVSDLLQNRLEHQFNFSTLLSKDNQNRPSLIPATIIGREYKIKDFDAVIFFDHNIKSLEYLIQIFCANNQSANIKLPRYLSLLSLSKNSFGCEYLYQAPSQKSLVEEASDLGKKTLVLSDQSNSDIAERYFNSENEKGKKIIFKTENQNFTPALISKVLSHFTERILSEIEKKEFDFILALAGGLEDICYLSDFQNAVIHAKLLDEFIQKLADKILKNNGVLIITSPYGMAEEMVAKKLNKKDNYGCLPTSNPVPLVLVSKDTENKNAKNIPMLHELIAKPKNLNFIHQIVLKSLDTNH